MKPVTLGLIIGNRGFFPSHLCEEGRQAMLQVLDEAGFKVIVLEPARRPPPAPSKASTRRASAPISSTPIATRSTVFW